VESKPRISVAASLRLRTNDLNDFFPTIIRGGSMFCPFCRLSFDAPEDGGICPNCGAKYNSMGEWKKGSSSPVIDDGHHETGSDASEGDFVLNEMEEDDF
jgi:hypothetical protein